MFCRKDSQRNLNQQNHHHGDGGQGEGGAKAGYDLSEVTRDLHSQGICGVMTDYEAKFHDQGVPINRCVGTKLAVDPEPEFHPIPGWGDAHPGVRPDSEREEADGQAPEEEQAD